MESIAHAAIIPLHKELMERNNWLIRLRWWAVGGVFLAVLISKYLLGIPGVHYRTILVLDSILLLTNVIYFLITHIFVQQNRNDQTRHLQIVQSLAFFQISIDLILLTIMLHFSGGISNPFIMFFFFHMIISSILLSGKKTYYQAVLSVILVSTMAWLEYSGFIRHYTIYSLDLSRNLIYVSGTIFAFCATIFIAVYMATSIMARLRKEEEVRELALFQLKELETEKSKFLRVVSHELRSPILAIQSVLSAILAVYSLEEKIKEMIKRAFLRADDLLSLTKDILELSRQNALNQNPVNLKPLDIMPIMEDAILFHKTMAEDKDINYLYNFSEKISPVYSDAEGIYEMVSNIISNAIRYTPPGGTIYTEVLQKDKKVEITVKDTGIGIPVGDHGKIFKEFHRSQNARNFVKAGTGLGLTIVNRIVERYNGKIEFESQEGKGTTFRILLPCITSSLKQA